MSEISERANDAASEIGRHVLTEGGPIQAEVAAIVQAALDAERQERDKEIVAALRTRVDVGVGGPVGVWADHIEQSRGGKL